MTHEEAIKAIRNIVVVLDLWEMRAEGRLTISALAFAQLWAAANEEGRQVLFYLIENPCQPEIMTYPILSSLLYVMSCKEHALYASESEKRETEKQLRDVVEKARAYLDHSPRGEFYV